MKKIYVEIKPNVWETLEVHGDKKACELLAGILINYYRFINEDKSMLKKLKK